jgi:hypothetical protein
MEINAPQALVNQVAANETWLLWGRGTGKTVGGIAPWMVRVATAMPGHLGGIFGKSYTHLDNNIMPKLLLGLTALGYQQGVDFVVGVRPPKDWDKCLYPIKDYERTLTWPNGSTFQQVSMHEKGSANAFDFQSGSFDEAKFFSKSQLEDEVFPTFRGFEHLFGHLPEYLSKIFATDKLGDYLELEWILNKRNQVDKARVEKILAAQNLITKLQLTVDHCPPTKQAKINLMIRKLQHQCNTWRKGLIYVSEASAIDNIDNLGMAWLADKKRTMSAYEFDVAILNKDPEQSKEGFYPLLGKTNMVSESKSLLYDPRKPLIIALDYQHSIAPLLSAQTINNGTYLHKELYALYPLGIENVIQQFTRVYQYHGNRTIYYVYDQTAIGKRAEALPLYEVVKRELKKNGWNSVRDVYIGDTPDHFDKYLKINGHLKTEGSVLINEEGCPYLTIALKAANTKIVQGKTKKDKEFENAGKYPHIDQRKTTHFPDVFDQIVWALNELKAIRHSKAKVTTAYR